MCSLRVTRNLTLMCNLSMIRNLTLRPIHNLSKPRRMSATRAQVLSLYKRMLREGQKFTDYNFSEVMERARVRLVLSLKSAPPKQTFKKLMKKHLMDKLKYAIRRTKDGFNSNKTLTDPAHIHKLVQEAEDSLKMLQRQVLIGQLYGEGKLVIESTHKEETSSR